MSKETGIVIIALLCIGLIVLSLFLYRQEILNKLTYGRYKKIKKLKKDIRFQETIICEYENIAKESKEYLKTGLKREDISELLKEGIIDIEKAEQMRQSIDSLEINASMTSRMVIQCKNKRESIIKEIQKLKHPNKRQWRQYKLGIREFRKLSRKKTVIDDLKKYNYDNLDFNYFKESSYDYAMREDDNEYLYLEDKNTYADFRTDKAKLLKDIESLKRNELPKAATKNEDQDFVKENYAVSGIIILERFDNLNTIKNKINIQKGYSSDFMAIYQIIEIIKNIAVIIEKAKILKGGFLSPESKGTLIRYELAKKIKFSITEEKVVIINLQEFRYSKDRLFIDIDKLIDNIYDVNQNIG